MRLTKTKIRGPSVKLHCICTIVLKPYFIILTLITSSTCSSSSVALIYALQNGHCSMESVGILENIAPYAHQLSPHLLPQSFKLVWNIILSCLKVRRNISTSLALVGSALDWFLQISMWNHTRPTKLVCAKTIMVLTPQAVVGG